MAIYSLSQRTTVTTIAAASWAALSPATNEAAVMEWGYFNGAATACVVGLGRTANTPTLTGGVAFLAEDEGRPTGLTQSAVAFGTAPICRARSASPCGRWPRDVRHRPAGRRPGHLRLEHHRELRRRRHSLRR